MWKSKDKSVALNEVKILVDSVAKKNKLSSAEIDKLFLMHNRIFFVQESDKTCSGCVGRGIGKLSNFVEMNLKYV